jgi:hypothetical protein
MLTYEIANMEDNYSEVVALCGVWWKDAEFYENTKIQYSPDYEQFKVMEDNGLLKSIIGRDEEGKIASCFICCITPFIFNPNYIQATELVWHVRKDQQGFKTLVQLLNEIEKLMKTNNIQLWNLSLPPSLVKTGQALEKFGYFKQDTQYMKINHE